ncbi:low-density lipoprotein receptor-related protein 2-like [Acanthaster planci]|uniref:Low-density lipoprotein receptor-related protein 2-like n=1 Tax=Acanthaster planci TaxID=133434 RepID=A0A8B7ZBD6_ACAPL|nr:low-density lipoprotein receptor-related protein 2-like [Acanthaster planci]
MGLCIPWEKKCDRHWDCYEGEDEDDCPCKTSEYKCKGRGGCIPRKHVCDGKRNCFDGSDENEEICGTSIFSPGQCLEPFFFKCSSHECIPQIFVCDGIANCLDKSDESECGSPDVSRVPPKSVFPTCSPGQFTCGDSVYCIQAEWTCDGTLDCSDGSDETWDLCGRPVCPPPKQPCAEGGGCGTLCDLWPECVNGVDETNCTCDILRNDNADEVVQKVICNGVSSRDFFYATEYLYKASCGKKRGDTVTPFYSCSRGFDCFHPTTMLPEPCKAAFSECYTAPNGWDYRGTRTTPGCLPWSDPRVAGHNYTGLIYRELEGVEQGSTVGHNFCRNPGGHRLVPWCFAENENGSLGYQDCSLTTRSEIPCHVESFRVELSQNGSDGRPTQGRVEVSFRTGAVGTISDPDWTIDDANVVCRQLGFPAGALANVTADFWPATGRVLLKDVQCMGWEENLIDCLYSLATDQDTNHTYDVGVACIDTNESLPAAPRRERRDLSLVAVTEAEACPFCSLERETHRTPSGCGEGSFRCGSGECIRYWQTCNKFPDCLDASDEWLPECTEEIVCGQRKFQCKEPRRDGSVRCISQNFVCDGYNDCGQASLRRSRAVKTSDEMRCPLQNEEPPKNYYRCRGGVEFIHEYDVCNTVEDCRLGDDEANCPLSGRREPFKDVFRQPLWYFRYRKLVPEDHHYLFENFPAQFRVPPFGRVKGEDPADWNGFVTFSATPDYSDLVDVPKLTKDEVSQYGHQKEDFILQCTYEQTKCNISNFETIQDDTYGNCFTFNADIEKPITASKTGARYGLQMTLFLEQDEYIGIFGPEAGARVSINPPHIRPSPTNDGITVKPGTVTSVGLRYNYVLRQGRPYGKCLKRIRNTKIIADGRIKVSSSDHYDRELCKKTCIHEAILKNCDCVDTLELDGPRCRLLNETQEVCRQLIYYLNQHNNLSCDCPEQCSEVYYTKTSSMSKWPSKKFTKHLLRNINSINEKTRQLNEENVFDNIARLEVFYEELNYESTKEVPAYPESSLFGDIGGIVGLYIGFSLITVCEFIALFLKLIKKSCCNRALRI